MASSRSCPERPGPNDSGDSGSSLAPLLSGPGAPYTGDSTYETSVRVLSRSGCRAPAWVDSGRPGGTASRCEGVRHETCILYQITPRFIRGRVDMRHGHRHLVESAQAPIVILSLRRISPAVRQVCEVLRLRSQARSAQDDTGSLPANSTRASRHPVRTVRARAYTCAERWTR